MAKLFENVSRRGGPVELRNWTFSILNAIMYTDEQKGQDGLTGTDV